GCEHDHRRARRSRERPARARRRGPGDRRRPARRRVRRLARRAPAPRRCPAARRLNREDAMLYELTDVTKRYVQGRKDVDALAGIDLEVAEGEFLAIQGSTGSGKTTLLQMLGALDRPSGGEV